MEIIWQCWRLDKKSIQKPCVRMFGSNAIAAFVSVDAHYSMLKAANQIGIGTNNIIKVDVDGKEEWM